MNKKIMLTIVLFLSFSLFSCDNDTDNSPKTCEEGYDLVENQCVEQSCKDIELHCEEGFVQEDCDCVFEEIICDLDEKIENNQCVDNPFYEYEVFVYDEIERYYLIHVPEDITENAPLLFSLHGFTSNPKANETVTHFSDIADREGFVVVYPYGSLVEGISHWNAKLEFSDVDDLGFLVALAQYIQEEYKVSTDNTFITGFSNGGFMTYEAACQASDVFHAFAPVAGLMSPATFDSCLNQSIPLIHIHGAVDSVVPINAEMNVPGGWGFGPTTAGIIEHWNTINGNDVVAQSTIGTTTVKDYSGGENPVSYYLISDYDHLYPGSIDYYSPLDTETAGFDASEVIWAFFASQIIE